MQLSKSHHRLSLIVVLLVCAAALWAQAPSARKIDPPNWWSGMERSPMLLISGENLQSAKLVTSIAGVKVAHVQSSADGRYLFAWLDLAASVKAGDVRFTLRTPQGETNFNFPILARRAKPSALRGLNNDDVVYLIMPDRFADGDAANNDAPLTHGHYDRNTQQAYHGGDFKGVEEHLDYLKQMGVTALWMTPFVENDPQSPDYHGYHFTDFYGVEDHFGSLAELQHLTAEAHKRGIKLVMDYIVNHTGPRHPWAEHPPTATWLHGSLAAHKSPSYEFWPIVDPHGLERERRQTIEGWFADKLPDLNTDDPLLTRYLEDNAIWWVEQLDLDAYRLDTFPYSSRESWSVWLANLHRYEPGVNAVGEIMNSDPIIESYFEGGRARAGVDTHLDMVFDFPLSFAMRDVLLHRQPVTRLNEILRQDALYEHPERLVTLLSNHDFKRFMGETGATVEALNCGVSLLMTMRGIPQLYSGDEIAMPGGDDPDNRRDFPGGFPGDKANAFTPQGRTGDQQKAFDHLREMSALRHAHTALRTGWQTTLQVDADTISFARGDEHEKILVIFNNASTSRKLDIDLAGTPIAQSSAADALTAAPALTIRNGHINVEAPASSVIVYHLQTGKE